MHQFRSALAAFAVASLAQLTTASAETELKNDGFAGNGQVSVQAGFYSGEIGASRFVAPAPTQLLKVRVFFGGAASSRTVTLHIWDDSGGGISPGAQLFEGDFELTGSDNALNEMDLSATPVAVPAQFRVGIEFQGQEDVELGPPAMARDVDGTIAADRNYLYAYNFVTYAWMKSFDAGLRGDWILRAVVADGGGTPDAGTGGPDAGTGGPDAGTGGPDAGTGGQCNGNGDCEIGEYCDTEAHACTFDCRHDSDCPNDGECNSLGQCVGATDGGGGCCETGGGGAGGALGALGLAGLVGAVTTRRRRRRDDGAGTGSRTA